MLYDYIYHIILHNKTVTTKQKKKNNPVKRVRTTLLETTSVKQKTFITYHFMLFELCECISIIKKT